MSLQIHSNLPIIMVDDEAHILDSLSIFLRRSGLTRVITIQDSRKLLSTLQTEANAVVILDLFMPHLSGTQLLPEIIKQFPETIVIIATASQEIETAISCMKGGAFDYLVKPIEQNRFISCVKRAVEMHSLRFEVNALKKSLLCRQITNNELFKNIITNSQKMQAIFQYIEAIAVSNEPVLIIGETGTGKEMIAQATHEAGNSSGPFVAFNAAGLDDNMFADVLFGHRKGAFTGADKHRSGLIATAAQGTLFLDEIGELSIASQIKLLRLLQEHIYFPLGSDVPKNSNVRIIAATNADLRARMVNGQFRADLFYRLASHQIHIPALRDRKEDIPLLVSHFLSEAANTMQKPVPDPSAELLTLLHTYHFPGNIRELRAMIFDTVVQHQAGQVVSMQHCQAAIATTRDAISFDDGPCGAEQKPTIHIPGRFPTLKEAELLVIEAALTQSGGNQGIAATLLGISRPALNRRLSRLRRADDGVAGNMEQLSD